MIPSLQNTPVDWGYHVQKSKKMGNSLTQNISWPSGKFIGGSGGMNVMFYVRGNQRDFDEWELAGNPSWNWQSVLPYFKKSENFGVITSQAAPSAATDELHGKTGPLHINSFVNEQPFKQTLFDAAQELGYKQISDINGNEYIGIGTAPGTIDQGKPYNSAKAYLSPAKNRPNLHVIKYAHVTGVNVDNTTGQVTGVNMQINKTHDLTAVATKEVILSAGSIGTPKILQLSGIGPEKYLRRLNVSTVRNLHTGFSLQNHVTVPLFLQFNVTEPVQTSETTENAATTTTPSEIDSTDTLYDYIRQRKGVFSPQNVFDVLGFFNTVNATDAYPNIGTHYAVFKRDDNVFIGEYLKNLGLNESASQPIIEANKVADIVAVFVTILNPLALGKVSLNSTDPYELPLIQSNVLSRREDIATLVQGIQFARKFLNTTAFQQIGASEIVLPLPECETVPLKKQKNVKPPPTPKPEKNKKNKYDKKNKGKHAEPTTTTEAPLPVEPVPEVIPYGSDQYFECYVKQLSTALYHPTSTSKMGPITDRFAVVDSRLNVHTLKGLRVIDASVMPKIVSANVNAATIMIAEKGSDMIIEDWALAAAATEAQPEVPASELPTTAPTTPDATKREEL